MVKRYLFQMNLWSHLVNRSMRLGAGAVRASGFWSNLLWRLWDRSVV